MGMFLGIGVIAGFIMTVLNLLIVLLPYIVLAALIAEGAKKEK